MALHDLYGAAYYFTYKTKTMKQIWFKRTGWFYIPVHPLGFLVTLLAIAFLVPVVIVADRSAHSVSDELYSIFVFATCTAFWWKWVADKTSTHKNNDK